MRNSLRSLLSNPILRLSPILMLALLLRLWDLDARSIWFDEAVEFWAAKPTPEHIIRLGAVYIQPPLFSFTLHFWMELGSSVIWMRLLSVLLSLGSTIGIMYWAYKNFSITGAAFAGLLFAILPAEIRYAQDISQYSLLLFGLTWSLVFLDSAMKEPHWRNWMLWGFFSLVAMYSHYGAAIPLASTGLVTALSNIRHKDWDRLKVQLTVVAVATIAVVPLLIFLFSIQVERLMAFDLQTSSFQLSQLLNWFKALDEGFLFLTTGWPYSLLPPLVPRGLLILLGLLFVYVQGRGRREKVHPVFIWSLVTYSAYFLFTEVRIYAFGNYGFRHFLILLPLIIMVITTIFDRIWRSDLRPAVYFYLAVFIIISAYSLPNRTISDYTRGEAPIWPETEDIREVYRYWSRERSGEDPTYVYYSAIPAFRYYTYAWGEQIQDLEPAWLQTCWTGFDRVTCENDGVYYGVWIRALSPENKLESITATLGKMPTQFWIIFSHTPDEEEKGLLSQLIPGFEVEKSFQTVGASAYMFTRR